MGAGNGCTETWRIGRGAFLWFCEKPVHRGQPSLARIAVLDEGNFITLPNLRDLDGTLPDVSGWRAARQVAYYHISASGGLSLRNALQKVWGEDCVHLDTRNAMRAFLDTPAEQRQQTYFIASDVPGRIRRHLHPSTKVMTLLRDPVRQVIGSYYWQYLHRGRGLSWVEPSIEEGISLRRYIEIQGADGKTHLWSLMKWLNSLADDPLADPPESRTMAELIEIIEAEIDFIGITEYFDESLFVLSLLNSFRRIPTWSRVSPSVAARREDLDPAIIHEMERLLEPDIALYERYRSLFLERYAEPIAWCRRHIDSLERDKVLKQLILRETRA